MDAQHELVVAKADSRPALETQINSVLSLPLPACLRLAGLAPAASHSTADDRENVPPHMANTVASTVGGPPSYVRPVYEVLLEKGRIAEERRERRKQEAIARELQELRAAPKLTHAPAPQRHAAAAATPAEGRIEDRLLKRAKERDEQRQHQATVQQEKAERQLAAVATFHPRISKRAQSTKPKVYAPAQDREAWRQHRKAELELARENTESERRGAEAFQPAIDKQSEVLAHRAYTRAGLQDATAADRILARAAQRRSQQWARFDDAASRQSEASGKPSITPRAAAMVRTGTVSQRLYDTAFDRAERQWEREMAYANELDGNGGGFAPRITKPGEAASPRYLDPAWATAPRRSRLAQSHSNNDTPSFQPSIDPVSAILASELETSPWERLHASTNTPRTSSLAYSDLYRPSIRPLSTQAAAALEQDQQRRQEWYRVKRQEQAERECEECTFRPRTNAARQRSQPERAHLAVGVDADDVLMRRSGGVEAVAARSRAWEDRRQQRLQELRSMAFSDGNASRQPLAD